MHGVPTAVHPGCRLWNVWYRSVEEESCLRMCCLHEKITNCRNDFLHQLSTRSIRENQVVYVEDLRVRSMQKNCKFAKSVSDSAWGRFLNMLEYKTTWYGRTVARVASIFPSS